MYIILILSVAVMLLGIAVVTLLSTSDDARIKAATDRLNADTGKLKQALDSANSQTKP